MSEQIISHLKNIETILQNMIQSVKNQEQLAEHLRSIENLQERMVASNERMEDMMAKSWDAYSNVARRQE